MEDLEPAPGSPALQNGEEPEGNNDPRDPLDPAVEEEDAAPTPPLAQPAADTEAFADDEAPETVDAVNDIADGAEGRATGNALAADDNNDDDESELEELDEKEFEDFDPSALNIPDKPVQVDADNVGLLGVHKRKRTAEEEEERRRNKKKREGRREKPKRKKRTAVDGDEEFEGGEEVEGKRARKSKVGADGRPVKLVKRPRTPEDEQYLDPDERRRRALDRKMDEALKTHRPTRRRAGVDLEAMADAEIEHMRQRMAKACELDADARARGDVATHKLKILPEVVELMNRNTIQSQLVDPDINILEAVRFMLEPADADAALPNYQIQRELFSILGKLNIGKEALVASGIGKVVLFYTKSTQPQPEIKRAAERLIGEWMRVVLKKRNEMNLKAVESRTYDPLTAAQTARSQAGQIDRAAIAAEKRRKALAQPIPGNRARVEGGLGTYTVAPVSNLSGMAASRRAGGEEAFRKIAARATGGVGGAGSKR